ncbi:hypothetical protein NL320_27485, partial [Klebsiella pneumoniae]|nr:hypothetical protein [Klebsiella pneumoniae]
DYIIFSSEVGVIEVEQENVLYKNRLEPGKMLLIDLEEGRIISDEEVKTQIATEYPYQKWLEEELVQVNPDPESREEEQ